MCWWWRYIKCVITWWRLWSNQIRSSLKIPHFPSCCFIACFSSSLSFFVHLRHVAKVAKNFMVTVEMMILPRGEELARGTMWEAPFKDAEEPIDWQSSSAVFSSHPLKTLNFDSNLWRTLVEWHLLFKYLNEGAKWRLQPWQRVTATCDGRNHTHNVTVCKW